MGRRHLTRGFTLIELMVVVIIIAILAVIAVPGILRGSKDRRTFEYSNRIAESVKIARARSIARGSAHMVVFTTNGTTDRGTVRIYEAMTIQTGAVADLNNVLGGNFGIPVASQGGRVPVGSCKGTNQWQILQLGGAHPGGRPLPGAGGGGTGPVGDFAETQLVDTNWYGGLNVATSDIDADHLSSFYLYPPGGARGAALGNLAVLCFSPSGRAYYSSTIAGLEFAPPMNKVFEMEITGFDGGVQRGPKRHVIFEASASPRIRSGE
jgi:prepilin-type N-terminal cleavage/methylation domain-containing protein